MYHKESTVVSNSLASSKAVLSGGIDFPLTQLLICCSVTPIIDAISFCLIPLFTTCTFTLETTLAFLIISTHLTFHFNYFTTLLPCAQLVVNIFIFITCIFYFYV